MKIGVLSDIHGNLVALEAALDAMPEVDAMVCAGDVVGYNPFPAECIERVRELDIPTVMGNHDRAVASDSGFAFNSAASAGVRYAREALDEAAIEWLRTLPDERLLFEDRVRVVHGHPDDPDRYTYPYDFHSGLLETERALVMGHTHVQGHEVYDEGVVMNPGSVGQPRDGDPQAAYSILDLDEETVSEHRVPYDIERVQQAIRDADLPHSLADRLEQGR
jgi:putative phosphoesterase